MELGCCCRPKSRATVLDVVSADTSAGGQPDDEPIRVAEDADVETSRFDFESEFERTVRLRMAVSMPIFDGACGST